MPARIRTQKDALRATIAEFRRAKARPTVDKYEPHDKQEAFHRSTKPIRLFMGGNRSGKTVGGCTECIMIARRQHPYKRIPWTEPIRLRIVTVDIEEGMNKIILPELSKWIPPSMLKNGSWEDSWDKKGRTLYLEDDGFIEIMTHQQELEAFAGTSRHGIWYDEEPPEDIFKECQARLIDTGGWAWLTETPVEGMTWTFEQLYEPWQQGATNIDVFIVDMTENPHLGRTEIEQYIATLSPEEIDARVHGKYVPKGKVIYPHFDTRVHVIDPFLPPRDWLHFESMDAGGANHTVWGWLAVNPLGDIYLYDEYAQDGKIVAYHAQKVWEHRAKHIDPQTGNFIHPLYSVGDPSIRNRDQLQMKSVQTEYMEYGIPIALGNNDVTYGINRVATMLGNDIIQIGEQTIRRKPRLFIGRNCTRTIWEFPRYRRKVWASKKIERENNPKEEPRKKDDHAMDMLRYAVVSRPELDDGKELPEGLGSQGFPAAHDPYDLRDEDVTKDRTQWETVDVHLGNDW